MTTRDWMICVERAGPTGRAVGTRARPRWSAAGGRCCGPGVPGRMHEVIPVRTVGIEDLPPLQARLCTNSLWFPVNHGSGGRVTLERGSGGGAACADRPAGTATIRGWHELA